MPKARCSIRRHLSTRRKSHHSGKIGSSRGHNRRTVHRSALDPRFKHLRKTLKVHEQWGVEVFTCEESIDTRVPVPRKGDCMAFSQGGNSVDQAQSLASRLNLLGSASEEIDTPDRSVSLLQLRCTPQGRGKMELLKVYVHRHLYINPSPK